MENNQENIKEKNKSRVGKKVAIGVGIAAGVGAIGITAASLLADNFIPDFEIETTKYGAVIMEEFEPADEHMYCDYGVPAISDKITGVKGFD